MVSGTVKWFNAKKGYGFITPVESEEAGDIFVHYSGIINEDGGFRTLYQGDKVSFELKSGDKGKEAHNVAVVERAPRQKRPRRYSGRKYPRKNDDSENEEEEDEE